MLSPQWLPLTWRPQIALVIYRWVVLLYFFVWFVVVCVDAATSVLGFKCLIYVSYWGFLLWIVYLVYAAVATTVACSRRVPMAKNVDSRYAEGKVVSSRPQNKSSCGTTVAERLHWLLFTLGNEAAVSITILFWVFFHNTESQELLFNPISLHIHLVNGFVALIDVWLTSIPICLAHAAYIMLFGAAYIVFTGVYYALNGTDPGGHSYIYPMLNYESNPAFAAGLAIGCVLGYLMLIHLLFFTLYLVRTWTSNWIQRRCFQRQIQHRYTTVRVANADSDSDAESYITLSHLVSEY